LFWICHSLSWLALAAINFVFRQVFHLEGLEQGIALIFCLVFTNVIVCLFARELIYRFELLNSRVALTWFKFTAISVCLGFVSALITNLGLGYYFIVFGYAERLIFFMSDVYANWLFMSVIISFWMVVYILIENSQRLIRLVNKENRIALQLKGSQLNTLIGQLNPHFLFNCLNNIRSLTIEDVDKSRDMLTCLSEILRYSLQSNKLIFRSLKSEINIVENYIGLATIQYEKRLNYIDIIDENLFHYKVPPMLIQLLVENAIRHGIDKSKNGGELCLKITSNDNKLYIEVSNTGSLNNSLNYSKNDKNTGLGLDNIRERLNLLFSERASFSIEEKQSMVNALVIIPLVEELAEDFLCRQ